MFSIKAEKGYKLAAQVMKSEDANVGKKILRPGKPDTK